MSSPLVSVVLPTYNRAHLVGKAIESVLVQTMRDLELIIVDDASTDETLTVLSEWKAQDPRISIVRHEKNSGISKALNSGFRAAQGAYCAVIDDDDRWLVPNKLERQTDFLSRNPEYAGTGGGVVVINRNGKELFRYLKPETDEAIKRSMFFSNPIANATAVFRRSAGERAGFWDETISHGADREFWMHLGTFGKLYNFQDYFASYTIAGQNNLFRHQRVMYRCILDFFPRYKHIYPRFWAGMLLHYGIYAYSLLPDRVRALLSMPLFYLKKKVFDSARKVY